MLRLHVITWYNWSRKSFILNKKVKEIIVQPPLGSTPFLSHIFGYLQIRREIILYILLITSE